MYIDTDNKKTTLISPNSSDIYHQERSKHNASTSKKGSDSFENSLHEAQSKYVKNDTKTNNGEISDINKLLSDIKSVIKKSLTKEEIEVFKEMLEITQEKLRDNNPNIKELENLVEELEKKVSKFKKDLVGMSVFEHEDVKKEEMNSTLDTKVINYKSDTRTEEEIKEDIKKLFEDIKSVMRTGMTTDEIKALEELIAKIKEEIKKENYNKKDVQKMMDKLEKEIALYKKKITGEEIIDAESIDNKDSTNSSIGNMTQRLDMAEEAVTELKRGAKKNLPDQMQNQSELFQIIMKFKSE
ncbi:MAG: hypothetical protein ACNI28_01465 [Arcobacter sp.]|uniref:hypothetical protein n=1 Tax=Arcobacter sp. TaxID=1872629 RepID=UPI003AFFF988